MGLADRLRAAAGPERQWSPRPEVLLSPNTAKPVHGLCPRVVLGQEWWDEVRREAYRSTNFHCIACGVHKYEAKEHQWLEGHELYRTDYLLGRVEYVETVPLCHYCHAFIHWGRLQAMVEKGLETKTKYNRVMRHGKAVLRRAGLRKPPPYGGPCAAWGDWRLVVFGREYPPIYKSYEHWLGAFQHEVPEE